MYNTAIPPTPQVKQELKFDAIYTKCFSDIWSFLRRPTNTGFRWGCFLPRHLICSSYLCGVPVKTAPSSSICRHETTRNPLRWIFVIFDVGKCNQHFPSPASICVNRTKLRAIWYEDLRAFLPYFQSKSLNIWRSGKWWSLHCGAKYSKHLRIDRFSGKSFHFRDN